MSRSLFGRPDVLLAVVIAASASVIVARGFGVSAEARLLRRAAVALSREDFQAAERLALRMPDASPYAATALLIAGRAAKRDRRPLAALAYYRQVSAEDDGSGRAVVALYGCADRLLVQGRAAEAERCLREVLRRDPHHIQANGELARLLQIGGRTWEALPYALEPVRQGQFHADELLMLGAVERTFVVDLHFVSVCTAAVPGDPTIRLGEARVALLDNRTDDAAALLRRIVTKDPSLLEAQARLGRIAVESGSPHRLAQWHAALPADAGRHPEIWFVRGLWAKRRGDLRVAVRCFLETAVRSPDHVGANYQLSQLLPRAGAERLALRFAERSALLAKLDYYISELGAGPELQMMRHAVTLLEQLGRYWEAAGWCDVALRIRPKLDWAREGLARIRPRLRTSPDQTHPSALPVRGIDLSDYPLPDWQDAAPQLPREIDSTDLRWPVRFVDAAAATGLDFKYFNGTTSTTGLEHMLQSTGGGIAVLDFDADGWPDLYFAQSGPWPSSDHRGRYRDRLFRNLGNGRFQDVTARAGLGDDQFSQGVTVGDYNGDGFPDLYVCNVGANRFYRNNGDGTFTDVTPATGTAGDRWSLSAALADLNGDGLADLYVVNYLVLEEVLKRFCKHEGRPMGCAPTMFPGEQDRVYLNRGDGRFEDVTAQCGAVTADGKGLGIVAADFDGSGRLSLFIGNDTTANFFFVNESAGRGAALRLSERGVAKGLAFDAEGKAQSCMGIATGDADGDSRLDLFVTNFYADSNTLYVQRPGLTFVDGTRAAGLRDPGFNMLGFGTQFLDAELDGWPDLVVTNGHVDRTFATDVPDLMPPQFFRNRGGGTFEELPRAQLGPYFQRDYLGRTLAVLDWNRDGRQDFCVSHLDAPAALLTNATQTPHHFLTLRCIGTDSARDATGTTVLATVGGRTLMRQLIAGDGYMAANQRQLLFGLGPHTRVDQLTVRWPSGREQTFRDVAADRELLVVEGAASLLPVPAAR